MYAIINNSKINSSINVTFLTCGKAEGKIPFLWSNDPVPG